MEKTFKIKEEDVKAILNYLAKRPFEEVFQGVNMLSNLEEISQEVKKSKKNDDNK